MRQVTVQVHVYKSLHFIAQRMKAVLTHLSGTGQWMPPGVPPAHTWAGQGRPNAGDGSSHRGGLGHPGESLAPPHPCPPLHPHLALLHPHPGQEEKGKPDTKKLLYLGDHELILGPG